MSIRSVIWDADGLIIDSEDADSQARREQFNCGGAPIDVAAYARYWAGPAGCREDHMRRQPPPSADGCVAWTCGGPVVVPPWTWQMGVLRAVLKFLYALWRDFTSD